MANFTAAEVKRLRELTGAGMMACKTALQDADGDLDKAVELLRLKGAKDVGKRAERVAANGLVVARHDGPGAAILVELNCETDFVAKGTKFKELADEIADFALTAKPADAAALLAAQIKPDTTVQALVDRASAEIGEKLELKRLAAFTGAYVHSYLHKSDPDLPPTLGVLVELDSEQPELAKDLAQQIAAMAPKYLSRDEVPAETVETERRLAEQMATDEGKPERAIPKIIEGRVNSYYKDFTLLEQTFVKDGKKNIKAMLAEAGANVRGFVRFKVGQA